MAASSLAKDSPHAGGWGDRQWAHYRLVGPASYTVITPGSAGAYPTGGQAITPHMVGASQNVDLTCLLASFSSTTGTYFVRFFKANAAGTSILVQWCVAATGAEVTAATSLALETVEMISVSAY